jgi:hypothetical protein
MDSIRPGRHGNLWLASDSAFRDDLNRAANYLDQELSRDPFKVSESRDPGEWVCFSEPLGLLIEIEAGNNFVWVLAAWSFR